MVFKPGDRTRYRPLPDRFWEKVDKNGPVKPGMTTACWEWTGTTWPGGYGIVRAGKDYGLGNVQAHRASWFLTTGAWPLRTEEVCHHCDNPPCVNPEHLFKGTHKDNMNDRDAKGRVASGARSGVRKALIQWPRAKGLKNGAYTHPEKVARGVEHPCAKLTDDNVIEIRRRLIAEAGFGIKAKLGREYGVDEVTIGAIGFGRIWKHLLPNGEKAG